MYSQEPRGKMERSCLRKAALVRFRAEYKIRKIRRWVQRSVPFVPDQRLGLFKAVRMCLNLRFRKAGTGYTPDMPSGLIRTGTSELSSLKNRVRIDPLIDTDAPFPLWWAWWKGEGGGFVKLYFGRTTLGDLGAGSGQYSARLAVTEREFEGGGIWERPEALGGQHLAVEKVHVEVDEPPKLRKKRFVWDLAGASHHVPPIYERFTWRNRDGFSSADLADLPNFESGSGMRNVRTLTGKYRGIVADRRRVGGVWGPDADFILSHGEDSSPRNRRRRREAERLDAIYAILR